MSPGMEGSRRDILSPEVVMEFVIFLYCLVAAVGAYQILVPYKYLPPYTPEELERIAYWDDIIANSSSEDS